MTYRFGWAALPAAALLASCGSSEGEKSKTAAPSGQTREKAEPSHDIRQVILSDQQIADAGIEVTRPSIGGVAGAVELPATIEADPADVYVVPAAIGGRLVQLTRNLGQPVDRGTVLAVIESRDAATLQAEIAATRARAALAHANLRREQRLFAERVSPEQDLIAARTTAAEADIALRLAQQQLSATGVGGGALNRIVVRAPARGQVIARSAMLGQQVAVDAELFRIANLRRVTVTMSLVPADAGRVRPGTQVEVTATGRRQAGRVTYISPIVDETTRLVPVIATLDNDASHWRPGENVAVSVLLSATGERTIAVPSAAVQMIADKPHIFVRMPTGFRATPVALGRTHGGSVTITKGLTGNERIASTNSFMLKAELGKSAAQDED
ncbi:efflux RND transporter periplasmic adaptor subunit [Sphingomonas sp.]|uniref:efflux RND transporter periplasmic adaptor subunit n=1 Tax=Sphingomonas sp. TaxID=28214 RepID=UPI003B3A54FC